MVRCPHYISLLGKFSSLYSAMYVTVRSVILYFIVGSKICGTEELLKYVTPM